MYVDVKWVEQKINHTFYAKTTKLFPCFKEKAQDA